MKPRAHATESTRTDTDPRRAASLDPPPELRGPVLEDAAHMWRMAVEADSLDANSPYAYLLVCSHFAPTSIVAEESGAEGLAGFVASYRIPDHRDVLFVWQVAVSGRRRGRGLGLRMLTGLLERPANRGVRHLHATVTPSNHASDRLFRSFARTVGAPCATGERYPADLFPGEGHEPEVLYRIGPFTNPPEE